MLEQTQQGSQRLAAVSTYVWGARLSGFFLSFRKLLGAWQAAVGQGG